MSISKSSNQYPIDSKCDLITASTPVFLSDLHEKLDELDNVDVDEILKQANIGTKTSAQCNPKTGPVSLSDLFEGLAQLTTTGAVEVTEIVEAIHSEMILRPLGRYNDDNLSRWQNGLTRRVYNGVRQTMQLLGTNLTATGIHLYRRSLQHSNKPLPDVLKRLVNVINGMMGDHLVTQNNPLAVPMRFYDRYGQPQRLPVSGRIVVLCHGLCLSYLTWHPCEEDSLGEAIVLAEPKATVLYLDYNTGRRISQNGHCLSALMQQLVDDNPDITQIDLVGYSMGGLISRSALYYAEQEGLDWLKRVGNFITIGTPHHGAILERISYHVLDIIGKVPFAGSLSKLGNIRSAGIIDLRHGSIRDEDWQHLDVRDVLPEDFRHPAKLPSHVRTFFIAGTIAEGLYDSVATSLVGDGLVMVESALGENPEHDEYTLYVPEGQKAVFYEVNHINLQYDERVRQQVIAWLTDNGKTEYSLKPRVESFPDNDLEVIV